MGTIEYVEVARPRRDALIEYLTLHGVWNPNIKELIDYLYDKTDYFYGPASTRWHAAYAGGGFDHAFNVTKVLVDLTEKGVCKPWQRKLSPFLVGLLHDVTKICAYIARQDMNPLTNEIDTWYEYNPGHYELSLIHGEDSLLKAKEMISLTKEEQSCIRWHMGAYEGTTSWDSYDAAIKEFPNVLWTHTADMYASKIVEHRLEEC